MRLIHTLLILALCLCLGCSDGTSSDTAPLPAYDFTGTWDGSLTGATTATTFTMNATQTDATITGFLFNDAGYTFSMSGYASGSAITLDGYDTLDPGYTIHCSGTCDGTYASGTWYDSFGQAGYWEAWIR